MQAQDRFRRLEQLNLYHPRRKLPQWEKMPSEVQQKVIRLLVQMLVDHHDRIHRAAKQREAKDE